MEEREKSSRDSTESTSDSSVDSGVFTIGCRVRAEVKKSGKWVLAKIIDVRKLNGKTQYCIHYFAHPDNMLHEWVPKSCLNIIVSKKKTSSSSISSCSLSSLSSLSDEDVPPS